MNKEKLITWLEDLSKTNALSQAFYAIEAIIKEIKTGTFDKEVTPCKNATPATTESWDSVAP